MLMIQDILRASHTKRWTIARTAVNQSLAEHTFNVVMIARAIAKEACIDDSKVIKYALEHDLDEILTGDMPTPAKDRLDMHFPSGGKNSIDSAEYAIVKASDIIEALWFITEAGVGRHSDQIKKYLEEKLIEFFNSVPEELKTPIDIISTRIFEGDFEL